MARSGKPHKRPAKKTVGPSEQQTVAVGAVQPAVTNEALGNTKTMVPAWVIARRAAVLVWSRKGLFSGLMAIYAVLNLVLVEGLASSSALGSLQSSVRQLFHGHGAALGSSLGNFALLIGSAGSGSSPGAGVWQFILIIITSLALIWALRQAQNHNRMRVRDTFYLGMYPLVPFLLVLFLIGIELLPLVITSALYTLVVTNGIAAHLIEKIIWVLIFVAGAGITLYFLCTSIIALYIVTLPDMTPFKALRSAQDLVRGRRLLVLRKILFLPLILLVVALIIIIPTIAVSSGLTIWVFFIVDLLGLLAVHAYLYALYRDLLDE